MNADQRRFLLLPVVLLCALCALGGELLAAMRLPAPLASLAFTGGDTDVVNCGSGSSLDNLTAFTWYGWVYPTAVNQSNRYLFNKADGLIGKLLRAVTFAGSGQLNANIDRATAAAEFDSAAGVLSANSWQFVALTYDESDGPRGWHGTLTGAVAEVSYDFRAAGSGATSADDTKDFSIGGKAGSSVSFPGRIAIAAVYNRRFTQAELRAHQMRPFCATGDGCVGFWRLGGAQGAGTQADLSGNGNNCTVTGATVADHVPAARWP